MADEKNEKELAALEAEVQRRSLQAQAGGRLRTLAQIQAEAGSYLATTPQITATEYLGSGTAFGTAFTFGKQDSIEVDFLRRELATTTGQMAAMQKQVAGLQAQLAKNTQTEQTEALQTQVATLAQNFDQTLAQLAQTQKQTEGLFAPVLIPAPEDMQIRLVPTHWLDQLEQHRADGEIALVFAALFGGAILGILVNWATNEQFVMTLVSKVLMWLFAVLVIGLAVWVARMHRRAALVRARMLQFTHAQQAPQLTTLTQPEPKATTEPK